MAGCKVANQSRVTSPNCTRSMKLSPIASTAPIGAALLNTTIPTSAEGTITKLVAAPSAKAPEWPSMTRPDGVTPTLKPKP